MTFSEGALAALSSQACSDRASSRTRGLSEARVSADASVKRRATDMDRSDDNESHLDARAAREAVVQRQR